MGLVPISNSKFQNNPRMKNLVNISIARADHRVAQNAWHASVAHAVTGSASLISIGESELHASKEAAWDSIRFRVERLDYVNDEVRLNGNPVTSAQQVEQLISQMS